jgi:hypothetical protein
MRSRLSRLDRIMSRSEALGRLRGHVRDHQALLERVRSALPEPVAEHCAAVAVSGNRLVVFADSPAWGSRIRFLAPRIIQALSGGPTAARTVKVRILPAPEPRPRRKARAPARLAATDARVLEQMAEGISDPDLRAALKRLAARARP